MEVFKADDINIVVPLNNERVYVPEINRSVIVRSLTANEKEKFDFSRYTARGKDKKKNVDDYQASLIAICMCDESGVPLFQTEAELKAAAKSIGNWPCKATGRVFSTALELNAITGEEIEDATKNLPSEQNSDGGSDSQDI